MATYNSAQLAASVQSRNRPDGSVYTQEFQVTIGANATDTDVINLCKIARGARVVDFAFYVAGMDNHASPTLGFKLGTSEDDDILGAGLLISAGRTMRLGAGTTPGSFAYTVGSVDTAGVDVEKTLLLTATSAVATAATGTIKGHVLLAMQN